MKRNQTASQRDSNKNTYAFHVFVILILFFGIFFAVSAEQNKGMSQHLGLSTEQEQKIRNLKKMCHEQDSVSMVKLKGLRRNLFIEAGKDEPDIDRINEIADEIGATHAMLALCLANQIKEMKAVLTKEQFAKFIGFRQQNSSKNSYKNKQK